MSQFLFEIAERLADENHSGNSQTTVVLPTRRAAVFLRHHLASLLKKTIWAPDILSIEDFIFTSAGYQPADSIELVFELYAVHCEVEGDNARMPDDFFAVAEVILADFDEVDQHLIDPDVLFNYLHEARAIDLWNPDGSALTDFQKSYLAFYASLSKYYSKLREKMLLKERIWQGLASRIFRDRLTGNNSIRLKGPVLFAGFNAFTPAEESIVGILCKDYGARVSWDTDAWYVENQEQEAGLFLRKYRGRRYPAPLEDCPMHFATGEKNFTIMGAPLQIAQVKQVGKLLTEAPFTRVTGWQSNTAIVLADESLLLPLLNSIPPSVGKFNVTMGLPLRNTPAGSLAELWLELFSNLRPNSVAGEEVYFISDFYRVAMHPLMIRGFGGLREQIEKFKESDRLYIDAQEVCSLFHPGEIQQLSGLSVPGNAIEFIRRVIDKILEATNDSATNDLSVISIAALKDVFVRVQHYLKGFSGFITMNMVQRLFGHVASSVRIPFAGEPLAGIQIMGMLETRALDFENVIMVGVNDDILPGNGHSPSFIPGDIRTETFGMAGFKEKTSVMAYHFYRLLQRAKNVILIYNNIPGNLGKGEPSRFLLQIKHEFPKSMPDIILNEVLINDFPKVTPVIPIVIDKTPEVINKLRVAAGKGLSPTSLSLLVECPLRFYLSRVEGINEPEKASLMIESDRFGSAVHDLAEQFLQPLLNKIIASEDLSIKREVVIENLTNWFNLNQPDLDYKSGNNLLVFNVAVDYLMNFLKKEGEMSTQQKVIPVQLESTIQRKLEIDFDGNHETILFKGRVDRIDFRDDIPVVIDYKTGTVDPRSLSVSMMDTIVEQPKHAKALQLMTYAWMSAGIGSFNPPFHCAVWPLKAPSKALVYLNFSDEQKGRSRYQAADRDITSHRLNDFETALTSLLTKLFDPAIPFTQTEEIENCRFCPFRELCNRVRPGH